MKILLIQQEQQGLSALKTVLRGQFLLESSSSVEEGEYLAETNEYALIILAPTTTTPTNPTTPVVTPPPPPPPDPNDPIDNIDQTQDEIDSVIEDLEKQDLDDLDALEQGLSEVEK
jgi:hypothetical protein